MTEAYTLRAEIALEQKKLDFVNHLLSMTGDEIYDKYGFKRDETIISTAVFPDGMQADIKIVICDGENKPYTEAVLLTRTVFRKRIPIRKMSIQVTGNLNMTMLIMLSLLK